MKTLKILFAAIIFVGFTSSAIGQQNDNANINANATVLQQISVEGQENLEFDLVSPGVDKAVDLEGNVSAGTSIGSEQAGRFMVSAGANSNISLSYSSIPSELSDGTNTMGITFTSAWGISQDGSDANNTVDTTGANTTIETFPSNDIGGDNGIYVLLGGTVSPDNGQEAGTYSGEITLTAEYN